MKIYKTYLYLLIGFSILSCQNTDKVKKPKNLIEEEKMTDILYDMALIDALRSTPQANSNRKISDPKAFIFQKYDIDSAQLASSQEYYLHKFKINLRMYEEVRRRLKEGRDILDSLTFKTDSITPGRKTGNVDSIFKKFQSLRKQQSLKTKKDTLD